VTALEPIATWPVDHASAAVVTSAGVVETIGDVAWTTRIASVTKLLVAYAVLVAVEEGTLDLDEPAGPPGATVRHLLAHASGLPFDGATPIARPGARRIYSNTGFEVLGAALERASDLAVAEYLHEAVLHPLGMTSTELRGSPAKDGWSCVGDLARFAAELLAPTVIAHGTLSSAVSDALGPLPGVVPDVGRFENNAWGLGFEVKDGKAPHWMPPEASPRSFGHFGGSGCFLWVDPEALTGCLALTDREFGPWALELWPALGSRVLARGGR
jgi:CubicO group peptidase (beta-lactamase class C family)